MSRQPLMMIIRPYIPYNTDSGCGTGPTRRRENLDTHFPSLLNTHTCAGYGFVFLGSEQVKVTFFFFDFGSSFLHLLSGTAAWAGGILSRCEKIRGTKGCLARCGPFLPTYLLPTTTTIRLMAATIPGLHGYILFWEGSPGLALLFLAWVGNARSYVGLSWCGNNHRL